MRRGDLISIARSGDFGKPRPALVIQADRFEATGTVTVLLTSGTAVDAPPIRSTVEPMSQNRLPEPAQVMIDKGMSVKRARLGPPFGRLDDKGLQSVSRSLALFLGLV